MSMNAFDRKSQEYQALKRHWKMIQQDSNKLSHKRFYRPTFRMHLTNKEVVERLLGCSDELRRHYNLYQLLLFHFQEKQANHFFDLMEENLSAVHPMFQTVFRTFLKDRDKILNVLIKVIKHKVFGFRNFENFKKRILIALNIRKERTKLVLSRC